MIHICLPLYDKHGTYSKFDGVVICSVLENTRSEITFHLIHDKTLTLVNRCRFQELIDGYNHAFIKFYEIEQDEINVLSDRVGNYSIGTLFRLKIPEVIDISIDKVIYLDADIVVNLDIKELYDINISNYALAACKDEGISDRSKLVLSDLGVVEKSKYFNGGVLVLNLKYIRSNHDLLNDSIEFFKMYTDCEYADQDAFNYFFRNKVLFLEKKYNRFTKVISKTNEYDERSIFHFASVPIQYGDYFYPYELFWQYFKITPWCNCSEVIDGYNNEINFYRNKFSEYKRMANYVIQGYGIVVWGVNSVLLSDILRNTFINKNIEWFVDSNEKMIGKVIGTICVQETTSIKNKIADNIVVVILSKKYFNDIKDRLIEWNFPKDKIFNGEWLI